MIVVLLGLLLPLALIVAPPFVQIALSIRRFKNVTSLTLLQIAVVCFVAGLVLPACAAALSMYVAGYFNPQIKCFSGIAALAPLGWMLTIFFVPVIFLIAYLTFRSKQKNKPHQINTSA